MTGIKKPRTGKRAAKKLKVRNQTVQDLDVKGRGRDIKGGANTVLFQKTCFGCPAK